MATANTETGGLFAKCGGERKIAAILDRAIDTSVAKTAQKMKARAPRMRVPGGGKSGKAAGGREKKRVFFDKALAKAVQTLKGTGTIGKESIRPKAPDTAGRSFHFQYYSVNKTDSFPTGAAGRNAGSKPRRSGAAAHHAYIERESALEAKYEPEGPAIDRDGLRENVKGMEEINQPGADRAKDADGPALDTPDEGELGIERDLSRRPRKDKEPASLAQDGREPPIRETEGPGSGRARAAQAYIENPTKMKNGEIILSSFGTIGDTFEDRLEFWNLLEAHERNSNARVQNRIICELPHQSTPEARREILKRFTKDFEDKGLPYHVAIHAPGPDNDSRNYHAHIVFSERPAKRMIDPATTTEQWDFAITASYKTSSRNTRIKHPHRQDRLREFAAKDYLSNLRKKYAAIVTEVMKPIDATVIFDARSYKAMGLGVDPMKSINRIMHDRMREGTIVVQDADWTRRMISAEIRRAAQDRDADVQALFEMSRRMDAMKKAWPDVKAVNANLSPGSALKKEHSMTRRVFGRLLDARLAIEHERIQQRLIAKAEAEVCKKVIEATTPTKATTVDRTAPFTASEVAAHALLNEAAREELAEVEAKLAKAERALADRFGTLKTTWQRARIAPLPTAPTTRAADAGGATSPKRTPMAAKGAAAQHGEVGMRTRKKNGALPVGPQPIEPGTPAGKKQVSVPGRKAAGIAADAEASRAPAYEAASKRAQNAHNAQQAQYAKQAAAREEVPAKGRRVEMPKTPLKPPMTLKGMADETTISQQPRTPDEPVTKPQKQMEVLPDGTVQFHGIAKEMSEMMDKMISQAMQGENFVEAIMAEFGIKRTDEEHGDTAARDKREADREAGILQEPVDEPMQAAPAPVVTTADAPDVTPTQARAPDSPTPIKPTPPIETDNKKDAPNAGSPNGRGRAASDTAIPVVKPRFEPFFDPADPPDFRAAARRMMDADTGRRRENAEAISAETSNETPSVKPNAMPTATTPLVDPVARPQSNSTASPKPRHEIDEGPAENPLANLQSARVRPSVIDRVVATKQPASPRMNAPPPDGASTSTVIEDPKGTNPQYQKPQSGCRFKTSRTRRGVRG